MIASPARVASTMFALLLVAGCGFTSIGPLAASTEVNPTATAPSSTTETSTDPSGPASNQAPGTSVADPTPSAGEAAPPTVDGEGGSILIGASFQGGPGSSTLKVPVGGTARGTITVRVVLAARHIDHVSVSGEMFTLVPETDLCTGVTVGPGDECTFDLEYRPTRAGDCTQDHDHCGRALVFATAEGDDHEFGIQLAGRTSNVGHQDVEPSWVAPDPQQDPILDNPTAVSPEDPSSAPPSAPSEMPNPPSGAMKPALQIPTQAPELTDSTS